MIYAIPIGVEFTRAVIDGFVRRYPDPLDLARVRILTNSARTSSVLRDGFEARGVLQPKVNHWQGFLDAQVGPQNPLTSRVDHVLVIAELLAALGETQPGLLQPGSVYELAYLLLELLEQSTERALVPEDFVNYDTGGFAAHWQNNAHFFQILADYWHQSVLADEAGEAARQIERFGDLWRVTPHHDPLYLVGSTGSRIMMRKLMRMILAHETGGLILPAYDFDRPDDLTPEHPQFGFQDLEADLGWGRAEKWNPDDADCADIIKAALAPVPATDQWIARQGELSARLASDPLPLDVIEAEHQHDEVRALTAVIHQARQQGRSVALVTPDRGLVRRLATRLEALGIAYADSAGLPMDQTPAGVFAGLLLAAVHEPDAVNIVACLGHPFCAKLFASEGALGDRRAHLAHLRWFDQFVLRDYTGPDIWAWAKRRDDEGAHRLWLEFWSGLFAVPPDGRMGDWLDWHYQLLAKATGVSDDGWQALGGAERGDLDLFVALAKLRGALGAGGLVNAAQYQRFWQAWLGRERAVKRDAVEGAQVTILGQIEARTETADCVILASMNEGHWPSAQIPDIWLNRKIRRDLGLEVPERFVGLNAHDFLGGFSAPHLVISRALNHDGAPTIESRFSKRLAVLWSGFDADGWAQVLARGQHFLRLGRSLDAPRQFVLPEPRPAPLLAPALRPHRTSVTGIEALVGNPYIYYAQQVLRLNQIGVLGADLDAAAAGTLIHKVMETIHSDHQAEGARDFVYYQATAREVIDAAGLGEYTALNLDDLLDKFLSAFHPVDCALARWAASITVERRYSGTFALPDGSELTISARVDRLDQNHSGDWRIFDYKSGSSPAYSGATFNPTFALQLPITALIMAGQLPGECNQIGVIRYKKPEKPLINPREFDLETFALDFSRLLGHLFAPEFAYAAADSGARFDDAYFHLARYGEWLGGDAPVVMELGDDQSDG